LTGALLTAVEKSARLQVYLELEDKKWLTIKKSKHTIPSADMNMF
jgi:hypothetical protein